MHDVTALFIRLSDPIHCMNCTRYEYCHFPRKFHYSWEIINRRVNMDISFFVTTLRVHGRARIFLLFDWWLNSVCTDLKVRKAVNYLLGVEF